MSNELCRIVQDEKAHLHISRGATAAKQTQAHRMVYWDESDRHHKFDSRRKLPPPCLGCVQLTNNYVPFVQNFNISGTT